MQGRGQKAKVARLDAPINANVESGALKEN